MLSKKSLSKFLSLGWWVFHEHQRGFGGTLRPIGHNKRQHGLSDCTHYSLCYLNYAKCKDILNLQSNCYSQNISGVSDVVE